jgi:thymidine kinase
LVLLGEIEEYEPLSRAAYYKAMLREKVRKMDVNEAEQIAARTSEDSQKKKAQ